MDDLKYITFSYGNQTFPVVFPAILKHQDVRYFLERAFLHAGFDVTPTSAGFVQIMEAKTFGESIGMELSASPADALELCGNRPHPGIETRLKALEVHSHKPFDFTDLVRRLEALEQRAPEVRG